MSAPTKVCTGCGKTDSEVRGWTLHRASLCLDCNNVSHRQWRRERSAQAGRPPARPDPKPLPIPAKPQYRLVASEEHYTFEARCQTEGCEFTKAQHNMVSVRHHVETTGHAVKTWWNSIETFSRGRRIV